MNISIFVFGNDKFIATLPKEIRDTNVFSIEMITNLNEAVSRIQNFPPDVILVQASQDGSMELCNWLKEQTKLSWIYCILLEDRPRLVDARTEQSREWELDVTCTALRQGADAYIWYSLEELRNYPNTKNVESDISHRLLLAQLTVGFRKAQKYRDLIRTNDVLSAIALADSLTDFNNRRALEWELPKHIDKARTTKKPLSLIILDVDYFKRVNDNHGHLVGDRLLQLLCTRLRYNLRYQDTPFRYGGEEFVILLSDTTSQEAYTVARRLNHVVSDQPFAINSNLKIDITISLGTASLRAEDDPEGINLLDRADRYLLQAKSNGRNCVISCNNSSTSSVSNSHTPHLRVVSS
ncbi:GGDEF domain-containing protein [Mastigocoleus testarum]|uniref:Diguanylate cyclase n=1 Tax=Mastigocoleus testarum BC008 TaxID=371196 RepID=A0A0V7ZFG5_9CYAN|nr:diguanylate cyclase [Mastigocoleus testarum]KST62370.1 diguanylate cyclase [Mastigocoleus testarum BC008]KST63100.1 diguanylate cyclase [Mastigocoleus testarum BC008]